MKIIRGIYSGYAAIVFIILFLLFMPFLLIPIAIPSLFNLAGIINRIWAKIFFTFLFMPLHIEYRKPLSAKKQYVLCPNHFSYLDIPIVGAGKINAVFVGKSDMEKIPLFGYMYKKLHITVDRSSLKSKYSTYIRSLEAIDHGKSLVIFPEGGILSTNPPQLARFKDGAFRVAIEKQIPMVPVIIPDNWIILPESLLLRWRKPRIIFLEPIETKGMSLNDLGTLKEKVFKIMQNELLTD